MIIVKFDGIEYPACPDGKTEEVAMEYIASHAAINGDITVPTSSSILIHQFCNMIAKEQLSNNDIVFVYGDSEMTANKYGRIENWIKEDGFCDHASKILIDTMRTGIERRKKEREQVA